MGIKAFHIVFVLVSLALCLFVGVWGFREWRVSGGVGELLFGCGGLLVGVSLVIYGRYVLKKLKGMSYL